MEISSKYKWCVIVPTYNNPKTLSGVLDGILHYTRDIIVVNDGSSDATAEILGNYRELTILEHAVNQGKGAALRNGFAEARRQGFDYAITIDSDGQHFPDDIPVFLNRLDESDGNILLIGARNMTQAGVPKKSSFGNRFSNFWYWVETGIKLSDTQSGFRLYPVSKMPKRYFTPKFEFEIESIVRAAWKGIQVENVPVKVYYDPLERVSHFRPFRDFTRISVLNTVLVIITLFYIKPRNFLRQLKKKDIRKFLKEEVLESGDSILRKASSVALGVFWGIVPLWGFQTLGVLGSAYVLRLNKLIAFAFSNVSLPPFIPVIIWLSFHTGSIFVKEPVSLFSEDALTMDFVKMHLTQYLIGSTVLAVLVSTVTGILSYCILWYFGRLKQAANA